MKIELIWSEEHEDLCLRQIDEDDGEVAAMSYCPSCRKKDIPRIFAEFINISIPEPIEDGVARERDCCARI